MDVEKSHELAYTEYDERIPTLEDLNKIKFRMESGDGKCKIADVDMNIFLPRKCNYVLYNNYPCTEDLSRRNIKRDYNIYNYCFLSVCVSFLLGLLIGVLLMGSSQHLLEPNLRFMTNNNTRTMRTLNSLRHEVTDYKSEEEFQKNVKKDYKFPTVSFTGSFEKTKYKKDIYPKGLTEDMKIILQDNKVTQRKHVMAIVNKSKTHIPDDETVLYDNIFWGPEIENSMPQGYGPDSAELWEKYVNQSEVVKMETGCGRMQNRLVTFRNGLQACVRYRQNTDQIQGEIFSFYVAKLLNLTNLAPSVVRVVDVKNKLWENVANDIATAQWNSNRAVVLTQYIPSLESATIPDILKPTNRHLNKFDIYNMAVKEKDTSKDILLEKLKLKNGESSKKDTVEDFDYIDLKINKKTIDQFVELAQWSDLIVFDYLTANLDRIVNNLFNYQWNINIMDGPAHNLARKIDSGLLLFLDNESGLLHGYRLLKKYNVYHSLMLDNLCVFRKTTIDALKNLNATKSAGVKLSEMFHRKNNAVVRDILPPLPEKNVKILHERISKVLNQVDKCEQNFSNR